MNEIFNLNNKFFQGFNKVIDCLALSVLWFIFSIPIVTSGAATTALYYTINKVIRNGRGYVWQEFWHAFRENFKQSTVVWLILLVVGCIMSVDIYIMFQFAKAGEKAGMFYIVFVVLLAFELMWGIYIFPYIARFENATKVLLKNTALIAIGNLLKTLLMFAILAVSVFLVYLLPVTLVLIPGLYMLLINMIIEKIFRKYMSKEDIEAEEERNREYFN